MPFSRLFSLALFDNVLEGTSMSAPFYIRASTSKKVLLEAFNIAKKFEARYSAYDTNSFIHHINTSASELPTPCKDEDMILFHRCQEISQKTEGAFDISVGALSHGAYHFGFSNEALPTSKVLQQQKSYVNYNRIQLNNNTISIDTGMRLDLGAIGKGYVAKCIAEFFMQKNVSHFLINVGGEIVSYGKAYTIAIKNPFSTQEYLGFLKTDTSLCAVSSSGDYERYIDSTEHHHIINTDDALPSKLHSSLTLIQNSINIDLLDGFATALFSKNIDAIKQLSKQEKFAALVVSKDATTTLINSQAVHFESLELR